MHYQVNNNFSSTFIFGKCFTCTGLTFKPSCFTEICAVVLAVLMVVQLCFTIKGRKGDIVEAAQYLQQSISNGFSLQNLANRNDFSIDRKVK